MKDPTPKLTEAQRSALAMIATCRQWAVERNHASAHVARKLLDLGLIERIPGTRRAGQLHLCRITTAGRAALARKDLP